MKKNLSELKSTFCQKELLNANQVFALRGGTDPIDEDEDKRRDGSRMGTSSTGTGSYSTFSTGSTSSTSSTTTNATSTATATSTSF